jgi:hypothetical protein
LKHIAWILQNWALLANLVGTAIGIVEGIQALRNADSHDKRMAAVGMLRNELRKHLQLPDFIEHNLEHVLSLLVNLGVWTVNNAAGKQWAEAREQSADLDPDDVPLVSSALTVAHQVKELPEERQERIRQEAGVSFEDALAKLREKHTRLQRTGAGTGTRPLQSEAGIPESKSQDRAQAGGEGEKTSESRSGTTPNAEVNSNAPVPEPRSGLRVLDSQEQTRPEEAETAPEAQPEEP